MAQATGIALTTKATKIALLSQATRTQTVTYKKWKADRAARQHRHPCTRASVREQAEAVPTQQRDDRAAWKSVPVHTVGRTCRTASRTHSCMTARTPCSEPAGWASCRSPDLPARRKQMRMSLSAVAVKLKG
eukprot:352338-Chlamydomonas_euryale.AAC.11